MKTDSGVAPATDIDRAVLDRYSEGAKAREASLCCPVDYDPRYLDVIPQEVLDRDYGCGNPSRYVRPGETVLDLGSGSGKICFIASQVVGYAGKVIGIDQNTDMLGLARQSAPAVAERVGYANVSFLRGRIQDLQLDLDRLEEYLGRNPVNTAEDVMRMDEEVRRLQREHPLVASDSVDVVISNCVLNLVRAEDKPKLFAEIYRVTRVGGRVAISDIVSDQTVPEHMQADPELWSGCISGALREDVFLQAFADAGFHGMCIVERGDEPWQTVEGIEFRSVTVEAYKGKDGPSDERGQAVVYLGPWRQVRDDDGHTYNRAERMAVCEKTFDLLRRPPYADQLAFIDPQGSQGKDDSEATEGSGCCGPTGC